MGSTTVNMFEAKTTLSKLVADLEAGVVSEVIIARNGRPAARLLPLEAPTADRSRRIGVARGRFEAPAQHGSSAIDDQVARVFEGV